MNTSVMQGGPKSLPTLTHTCQPFSFQTTVHGGIHVNVSIGLTSICMDGTLICALILKHIDYCWSRRTGVLKEFCRHSLRFNSWPYDPILYLVNTKVSANSPKRPAVQRLFNNEPLFVNSHVQFKVDVYFNIYNISSISIWLWMGPRWISERFHKAVSRVLTREKRTKKSAQRNKVRVSLSACNQACGSRRAYNVKLWYTFVIRGLGGTRGYVLITSLWHACDSAWSAIESITYTWKNIYDYIDLWQSTLDIEHPNWTMWYTSIQSTHVHENSVRVDPLRERR